MNVHHAIIAHTYTWRKHTLAATQQAVWCVCVCTQTGTVGAAPEGRRGQWQSQLCVWWPSQRSGAPSWEHKAPAPDGLTRTHSHAHRGEKQTDATVQNCEGKFSVKGSQQVGRAALELRLVAQDTQSRTNPITTRQAGGRLHTAQHLKPHASKLQLSCSY